MDKEKSNGGGRQPRRGRTCFYFLHIKRILDVVLTLVALLLFCWLYVLLSIIVRIKMGRPIIYASPRIGKDEKSFVLYKFRSMTNECDENGILLPGPQRLTQFGRFLRSTSLDELPSLINILKGDLSIVGPRPLLMKYLPFFYENERIRHAIRPGLTGWAQVNGRNTISWEKKFLYDIDYVENVTFALDLKIILETIGKVVKRSDIIQGDQLTGSLHIVRADMQGQKAKK